MLDGLSGFFEEIPVPFVGARIVKAADRVIVTPAVINPFLFDTSSYDSGGIVVAASNALKATRAGKWLVHTKARVDSVRATQTSLAISTYLRVNGAAIGPDMLITPDEAWISPVTSVAEFLNVLTLAVNDLVTVRFDCTQSAAGNVTFRCQASSTNGLATDHDQCYLEMIFLG